MDWINDLNKSNKAFLNLVWPAIKDVVGGGEIKPVEILKDNELARDLDMLCGIDMWQTVDGWGCRGIASRVQFGATDWGTFTIRSRRFSGSKTEYEKRLEAIQSGGEFIYPYITCHAYVDGINLVNAYVARTVDIFQAIIDDKHDVRHTTNAEFFAVKASDVQYSWQYKSEVIVQ